MRVFAWSPNAKMIAAVSMHNSAHVWDAGTGRLLHSIPRAHLPDIPGVAETRCIAWSPDSRQFATCGLALNQA
jgi:WD40 repeat protein